MIERGLREVIDIGATSYYSVYLCTPDYRGIEPVRLYLRRRKYPLRVGIFLEPMGIRKGWASLVFGNLFVLSEGVWIEPDVNNLPSGLARQATLQLVIPPERANPLGCRVLYYQWRDYLKLEKYLEQTDWPRIWGSFEINSYNGA